MRRNSKNQSLLNPSFPWALAAVIGQMAQSFVIGLPCTAQMKAMGGHYANVLLHDVPPKRNTILIPDNTKLTSVTL